MSELNADTESVPWKGFYKVAGAMALLIVLVGLADIVTSILGGDARANSTVSVTEWFTMFQAQPFAAFSNLGLINIITLTLGIALYLALYDAHRRKNPAFAALASIFFFMGAAVYISSNTVFSMYALSNQYGSCPQWWLRIRTSRTGRRGRQSAGRKARAGRAPSLWEPFVLLCARSAPTY